MNQPHATLGSRQSRAGQRNIGLTAIEMLCSISVTFTALGATVPSMREFMLSQRLQAAAAELETEVQLARSLAMVRAQTVRLAIQPMDQGSCTMIHTGPKDACRCAAEGPAVCLDDAEVLHLSRHDSRSGVRHLSTNVSLAFSATRGTVTPTATLKLSDSTGRTLHQVVNVMGRTRTCSAQAALPGYKAC